ncbi:unnamed protein product [Closterium sp. Yama58-4]|nr:unnamed protein product [Closterium sp. Yama58-4]
MGLSSARLPRWLRSRRARRNAPSSEAPDDFWWQGEMSEEDSGVIEAAMQAILMDGLAGALQGGGGGALGGGGLHGGARRLMVPQMLLFEDEEAWTYEQLLELDRNNVRRGLKQQEMWKLDRRKMGHGDERVDCQICLSEAVAGELLTSLPCKHTYHDACISPWFKTHRTCPICRFEIAD